MNSIISKLDKKNTSEILRLSKKELEELQVTTDKQINQLLLFQKSLQNVNGDIVEAKSIKDAIYKTEYFLYRLRTNIKGSIKKGAVKNGEQP